MTTKRRRKYLASCSEKEKYIREEIAMYKKSVRHWKHFLNFELSVLLEEGKSSNLYSTPEEVKQAIVHQTFQMKTYRHELNRLRGFSRVVVPRRAILARWSGIWLGYCKCGVSVKSLGTYCPNCGRKILWEKVNK